tara:strand:+ start:4921 stop:5478 length:558 start_codon:yes stop_codon:yes gene_type:complete
MKIHSSHSRKELIQVIEQFNIDITNLNDLCKKDISALLIMKLMDLPEEDFKEEEEYFFVSSKQELLDYLQKPNQSKILTIKEKDSVMDTAKKIISYCKNSFFLTPYNYETFDDLLVEANYISKFGDIPSVRRAITMLNQDPKLDVKVECIISKRVKKDIDKRNKLKQDSIPKAVVKRGHFIIDFS